MDQGRLNEHMTSIGLAYEPVQCVFLPLRAALRWTRTNRALAAVCARCDEADGTCAAISAELPYLPVMTFAEEDRFRCVPYLHPLPKRDG